MYLGGPSRYGKGSNLANKIYKLQALLLASSGELAYRIRKEVSVGIPTVEQLEAEIAALDKRRRAAAALLEAARNYEAVEGDFVSANGSSQSQGRGRRTAPAMEATETVATELMEQRNAPVATAEVVAEMQRRGMNVPEKNPSNVVSARLSNSEKFKGRRGQGYWFSDRPWPSSAFDDILGGAASDDLAG